MFDIGRYLDSGTKSPDCPTGFEPEGSFSSAEYGLSSDGKITVKNTSACTALGAVCTANGCSYSIQSQSSH